MFYKITLNSNHTNYKIFIKILEDITCSSSSLFLDNSFLVYNNPEKTIYIFYLQYDDLYYKDNYKHFEYFKELSKGCIVEYHEYNFNLKIPYPQWVVNNNFLQNYFISLLPLE